VSPDERLRDLVSDPGFTPKKRDVAPLVALLASDDEDVVRKVERALTRKPDEARAALLSAIASASTAEALAARACRVLPRVLGETHVDVVDVLLPLLEDERKRLRRAVARALGNMHDARIEAALATAFEVASDESEQKVLADALGKIGGARALAVLEGAAPGDDTVLSAKQTRARLAIERTIKRGARARIDVTRAPSRPLPIVWRCRDGLEELLANELGVLGDKKKPPPGRVEGVLSGPLARATEARVATDFFFPLPQRPVEGSLADAVVAALVSDDARAVFDAFSPEGDVTVRIAWREGGHRRSTVWEIAEKLAASASRIRNDPSDATWEAGVRVFRAGIRVELVPRALEDARFAWRLRDVPAASHPTIAAALARAARPRAGDVVWDPFCGSGAELVECALAAGDTTLIGTDTDAKAIAAARENLAAAHLSAELVQVDALEWAPPPSRAPTLVITNPPMGRRVQRAKGLDEMLDSFIRHVARKLAPHGRIVWLSPFPERTRAIAKKLGFTIAYSRRVDLGGFFAELMRLDS
jgi:23S rRNA G2445 N2-methylase RlmL